MPAPIQKSLKNAKGKYLLDGDGAARFGGDKGAAVMSGRAALTRRAELASGGVEPLEVVDAPQAALDRISAAVAKSAKAAAKEKAAAAPPQAKAKPTRAAAAK